MQVWGPFLLLFGGGGGDLAEAAASAASMQFTALNSIYNLERATRGNTIRG